MSSKVAYRADIDGLRAIAVLSVLLFHAKFGRLGGGFVGVDVFFVISGYLITAILYTETRSHTFSVARFYERRLRRIFPAFCAVVGLTAVASFITYFPTELANVGKSLLSTGLSSANIYFLFQHGYFSAPEPSMPLLHMWSLAVEEQFYLFFPFILIAIRRYGGGRYILWVSLLAAISLAHSMHLIKVWDTGAFYLVTSRAWELMLGSLLALGAVPPIHNRWANEALGLTGVALILGCVLSYTSIMPFPGGAALLPCLGAALVIYSGHQNTLVTRALSLKPVVFIGLISYSLYLIHWPLFVFVWANAGFSQSHTTMLGLIAVAILLASASWYFIERPFRNSKWLTRRQVFTWSAAATAAILIIASWFIFSNGFPGRFSPQVTRISSYLGYDEKIPFRDNLCFLTQKADALEHFNPQTCLNPVAGKPNILLMGDSHAAHLYSGLNQVLTSAHVMQATAPGCKPVLNGAGSHACTTLRDDMFNTFIPATRPSAIVIAARWTPEDLNPLLTTIEKLKPYTSHLIVVGPVVEYDQPLPRVLALQLYRNDPELTNHHRLANTPELDNSYATAIKATGATYISLYQTFCPTKETCTTQTADGTPVQFDYGHLTQQGAAFAVQQWLQSGQLKDAYRQ